MEMKKKYVLVKIKLVLMKTKRVRQNSIRMEMKSNFVSVPKLNKAKILHQVPLVLGQKTKFKILTIQST